MSYGTNAAVASHFPHTVLRIANHNVVSLNRYDHSELGLNLEILGADGRSVVEIKDNVFTNDTDNHFRIERPAQDSKSSLAVHDPRGQTVLELKYLNETFIVLNLGTRQYAGRVVEFLPEAMRLPGGGALSDSCLPARTADLIIELKVDPRAKSD